jgi:hypothetical protein
MHKRETGSSGKNSQQAPKTPDANPENPEQQNRRPAKTRSQAWAKIDAGKGTWKPR